MSRHKERTMQNRLQSKDIKGPLARKLWDNSINLAASLGSGQVMTEERRTILSNFYALAVDVNALETEAPLATGAGG